jgi:hypothetical protein
MTEVELQQAVLPFCEDLHEVQTRSANELRKILLGKGISPHVEIAPLPVSAQQHQQQQQTVAQKQQPRSSVSQTKIDEWAQRPLLTLTSFMDNPDGNFAATRKAFHSLDSSLEPTVLPVYYPDNCNFADKLKASSDHVAACQANYEEVTASLSLMRVDPHYFPEDIAKYAAWQERCKKDFHNSVELFNQAVAAFEACLQRRMVTDERMRQRGTLPESVFADFKSTQLTMRQQLDALKLSISNARLS